MTLASSAWGHDGLSYTGKSMRQLVEALSPENGVVGADDFLVAAQGTPNATVTVAAGNLIVPATGAGLFGSYHVANDASINSSSFTPTSGNGRWDYLILRVTAGVPALEIVEGTAAASPAAPAITGDNYEPLALVKLPGSTTNITNAMIEDARNQVVQGAWTSYTPTWTSAGTAVSLGNGTLTGRYQQTGRTVNFMIMLTFGSTTNGGTGSYSFALPTAAAAFEQQVLSKAFTVGGYNFGGLGYIAVSATTVSAYLPATVADVRFGVARNSSTGAAGEGIPLIPGNYTWTSGFNLWIGGTYEAAA